MDIDIEGIVIRQTKVTNSRRMLTLFTRKYGKISAGTSINPRGASRSSLATQPFTYGKYDLYKGKETYNINAAEPLMSFYGVGEDVEKYACSSYALEFVDRLLPEDQPAPELFDLLVSLLTILENRKKEQNSVLTVFRWKVLQLCGVMPQIEKCSECGEDLFADVLRNGKKEWILIPDEVWFGIEQGGLLCGGCKEQLQDSPVLLYKVNIDIIGMLKFIADNPITSFEKLSLDEEYVKLMDIILKEYISYHLGINNLKSESFLTENTDM